MATVQITVPDALVPRLLVVARANYPQYAGLADAALFRAVTSDYWRQIVAGYEAEQAAAKQTATTTVDLAGIA